MQERVARLPPHSPELHSILVRTWMHRPPMRVLPAGAGAALASAASQASHTTSGPQPTTPAGPSAASTAQAAPTAHSPASAGSQNLHAAPATAQAAPTAYSPVSAGSQNLHAAPATAQAALPAHGLPPAGDQPQHTAPPRSVTPPNARKLSRWGPQLPVETQVLRALVSPEPAPAAHAEQPVLPPPPPLLPPPQQQQQGDQQLPQPPAQAVSTAGVHQQQQQLQGDHQLPPPPAQAVSTAGTQPDFDAMHSCHLQAASKALEQGVLRLIMHVSMAACTARTCKLRAKHQGNMHAWYPRERLPVK